MSVITLTQTITLHVIDQSFFFIYKKILRFMYVINVCTCVRIFILYVNCLW